MGQSSSPERNRSSLSPTGHKTKLTPAGVHSSRAASLPARGHRRVLPAVQAFQPAWAHDGCWKAKRRPRSRHAQKHGQAIRSAPALEPGHRSGVAIRPCSRCRWLCKAPRQWCSWFARPAHNLQALKGTEVAPVACGQHQFLSGRNRRDLPIGKQGSAALVSMGSMSAPLGA